MKTLISSQRTNVSKLFLFSTMNFYLFIYFIGVNCFGTPLVAQMVKNLPSMRETRFCPWVRRIPWEREWQPTPVFWLGEFHGHRSLAGGSQRIRHDWATITSLHNCFTMVCYFLLYSKVNQLYAYIYSLPLRPPSYHPIYPTKECWAELLVFHSRFPLALYFTPVVHICQS